MITGVTALLWIDPTRNPRHKIIGIFLTVMIDIISFTLIIQ